MKRSILSGGITRRDLLRGGALASVALSAGGCFPLLKRTRTAGEESVARVDPGAVRKFVSGVEGRVVLPGDADYDAARRVWNRLVDKRPGMVVRCSGPKDVVRAVEFARRHDLATAVRAGGHSFAGKSVCDAGMVIDVGSMKRIEVDAVGRRARAESGVLLGEFDRAAQAFGLATTLGTVPTTGIAGLTLGGGFGWLMGKHGIACDNVRAVELVTAEGVTLRASADENEDLYWAARGAGANFGVVTAIEYELHPVGPVLGGALTFRASGMRESLRLFREITRELPDEMSMQMGTFPLADGPAHAIEVCHAGDLARGERLVRPLRVFGSRLEDRIRPMPYVAMQEVFGVPPRHGPAILVRSGFLRELDDAVIEVITEYDERAPSPTCVFFLEEFHGAACRIAPDATAFRHREPGYNIGIAAIWEDPAIERESVAWVRGFWKSVRPFTRAAVYSNYLADEGDERARAAYGGNYPRLASLKQKYDPGNFFRSNQNILPVA